MLRSTLIIVIFFALQSVSFVQATGLYSVIGPGTIRSNFNYNVAVSLHKADGPSKIKIAINGPSYNESQEIEVQPMSTQNVAFKVPKLESGKYNLTVQGLSGVIFENSTQLDYANYKPSVFIQTDKATYKPGDLVQFRVLFLDENTRPARIDKPITIAIHDGAQNRIKQLKDIELTMGVYSGELQLSEQPVLGDWNIAVSVEDEDVSESKTFEVAKYVLPKFEVSIDTSTNVAIEDGVIKATIRAKYTYNKPLKGKARITLKPINLYYAPPESTMTQEKTIDIDGKGHVEFDLGRAMREDTGIYLPPLKLFAEVEEELTGNKQNATVSVQLHKQRYRIEGVDNPSSYHPGKPLTYKVVVKNLDGAPVRDAKNKVKLSFEKSNYYFESPYVRGTTPDAATNTEKPIEFESSVDENGFATFEVTLPEKDKSRYSVRASFLNSTSYLSSISKFEPRIDSPGLLNVEVNTKQPRLGKAVTFEVRSSEPIPYFVYTIVARGNIVQTQHVEVPESRKSHTIKFTPTFAMVPRAIVYVHYIYNNDLRFEEQTINFEKDFENSIEIIAPNDAKPAEDIKLQIKTDPGSFVGLLGVDQSVLLLKSGNDLDRNGIFNSLDKYSTNTPWQFGYGRYPGETSGVVTLTNANYPHSPQDIAVFRSNLRFDNVVPITFFGGPNLTGHRKQFRKYYVASINSPIPIRQNFAENWIFNDYSNFEITDKTGLTIVKKIPDTITSWVITGFSLNPETGIALTKNPSKIRVFQPFFISTNLPYSVKRGEVIAIPVIVFNYMEMVLDAEVTIDNTDGEFEFTEATNEVDEKAIDEKIRGKSITVPPNSGKSVSFLVRPKNVGTMPLKITATTPISGDSIQQKLKVEPEGVTQFVNRAVFINLKNQSEFRDKLDVNVPAEAVPNSEYIEFSVVGDLLGPTIKNLDNLVRMPYGCGEQNMVNFVPNILVLKYLEATNQKMPAVTEKAKKFLEIGYQRELTYKHDDGSYSAFGKSDKMGSTWLTAYVMRSFHQAAKYTDVDPKIVKEGLDFLAAKQNEKGEFPEFGKLFDNSHQNALGLTSFVLLAFFENQELIPEYENQIRKAVEYVSEEVDKTDDQYSLSISAVALQLAKHPKSEKVLEKLESVSKKENDWKWWSNAAKNTTETDDRWYWKPQSNDVEITSYVLLALLERDEAESMLPIVKWLIAQRNSNGGFSSTQDTVIGLQALTKFAYKIGSGSGDIDIDFVSSENTENKGAIKVNPDNALVLQTHVLPKTTRQVAFTAKGKGTAMVQLSYRYNIADKEKKPSFQFKPITVKVTPSKELFLSICTTYTPTDTKGGTSNMVIMEVALPSGYTVDIDHFDDIEAVNGVSRIETKNSETIVVIYFDNLRADEEKCLPIRASRSHAVAKQKPVPVTIYDYYDTSRRATEYYQVSSSLCDICEGDDCGSGCTKAES